MSEDQWEGTAASRSDEEREVGGLIEAAGPRPTLAQGDLAAIRAAAESTWKERYEKPSARSSRSLPWLLAAALAAIAIGLGWWYSTRGPIVDADGVALVERLAGAATVREDNGPAQPLELSRQIAAGSLLSTVPVSGEERSFLTLRLASGHSLRLDAGTRMRLWTTRLLELEEGAIYVDSSDSATGEMIEVVTPLGTVTEIGTQFEVRLLAGAEAALRVRVRDGRVRVGSEEQSETAEAGEELLLDLDGSIERRAMASHGDEWVWVLDSAPALDIGGRTVDEVLEWVARETGWEIRFASEELERAKSTVPFEANIEVRPQDAHEFLIGVKLEAELLDGVLWVRAGEP